MSEIEKLYKNAGLSNMWVERYDDKEIWHKSYSEMISTMMRLNDWTRQVAIDVAKKECKKEYPPFTAEKQLNITKLIGLKYGLKFIANEGMDYMLSTDLYNNDNFNKQGYGYGYDEAIANLINNIWQDLTEEEKAEIKNILEM